MGAGDMGHGIAEIALMAGYTVHLYDVSKEALDRGVKRIDESLKKLSEKGKVDPKMLGMVHQGLLGTHLDIKEAVEAADLVIEAVPEIVEIKKELFKAVDAAAPAHALLASNTSTMCISDFAAETQRPGQVLGLHFFNPVVLMKLVEVIRCRWTTEQAMRMAHDFCIRIGKVPVRVEKDVPGFIVNRVQAPSGVLLGCLIDMKIAEPEEIDAALRKIGVPMGPFEIMDFTGLDVAYHANKYYEVAVHPDFRPSANLEAKVKAGNLGKKTGKGYFDWSGGRPNIDIEKAISFLDPMDLVAVQINEAMKLIEQGVCSAEDVDTAITNGTGNVIGPMAIAKGVDPRALTYRLEGLWQRFGKEIFKPADGIRAGRYR